ncbi:NS7c [Deltacoronavirus HNU1-1]|nr:NS7c [Deltacoronavirus HNU1-1]QSE37613.1 NS7c [Deltacoronavirus HNU1-2]
MFSLGYYFIKFFTLYFFGVFDPIRAEAWGPILDFEIFGFVAFILWIDVLRPRGANAIIKYTLVI